MKKWFWGLMGIVSFVISFTVSTHTVQAIAKSGKCGDHVNYNYYESEEKLILSGVGDTYDYPDNESLVRDLYFDEKCKCTTIVVEEGITGLGDSIFQDTGLAGVVRFVQLPDTLKSIGDSAFWSTSSLRSIQIPEGVVKLGNASFMLSGITSIRMPDSVSSIGPQAFEGCADLASIKLPAKLEKITHIMLKDTALENVDIPECVKTIESNAFENVKIKQITIPKSTMSIDPKAFLGCTQLKTVYFENPDTTFSGAFLGLEADITIHAKSNSNVEKDAKEDHISFVGTAVKLKKVKVNKISLPEATTIRLDWEKQSDADGYQIYRSKRKDDGYQFCRQVGKDTVSYTESGLPYNTKYYYKVQAIDTGITTIRGDFSEPCWKTTIARPPKPTLKIQKKSGQIVLSWGSIKGADGIAVYYKNSNIKYQKLKTFGKTKKQTKIDTKRFSKGYAYTFKVRCYKVYNGKKIWGAYTNEVSYKKS